MNRIVSYDSVYSNPLTNVFNALFGQSNLFDQIMNIQESVKKTDVGIEIKIPLAGLEKDNISVEVYDRYLKVRAEDNNLFYNRAWTLPSDAEIEKISADFKNGLLNVIIPIKKAKVTKISLN